MDTRLQKYSFELSVIIIYLTVSYFSLGFIRFVETGTGYELILYFLAGPISFLLPIRELSDPTYSGFLYSYFISTILLVVIFALLFNPKWKEFIKLVRITIFVVIWFSVGFFGYMALAFSV